MSWRPPRRASLKALAIAVAVYVLAVGAFSLIGYVSKLRW